MTTLQHGSYGSATAVAGGEPRKGRALGELHLGTLKVLRTEAWIDKNFPVKGGPRIAGVRS